MKINRRWLAFAPLVVAVAMAVVAASSLRRPAGPAPAAPPARSPSGSTPSACRWRSCTRRRIRTCKLKIVTYDGDGNGATTMQTKIQLWNRTGNGWPDVIFSEQANDPVWMASEAVRLRDGPQGRLPDEAPQQAGPRRRCGQCTVNGVWSASRTTSPRRCSTSTRS